MAAKTPDGRGVTGFVDPRSGVWMQTAALGGDNTTDGGLAVSTKNLKLSIFSFLASTSGHDIDSGDTWASGLKGIVACAWQPNDTTDDLVAVEPDVANRATGVVKFTSTNSNNTGWLWVLHHEY